jgi:hypothetical protein
MLIEDAAADTDDPSSLGGIDIAAFEDGEVSSDFLVGFSFLHSMDSLQTDDDASSLSGLLPLEAFSSAPLLTRVLAADTDDPSSLSGIDIAAFEEGFPASYPDDH